eukprot:gene19328-25192_t
MGNYSEFRRVVDIIDRHFNSFNIDVNVSVFETTIRILGGLLSAHLMAIDPILGIYENPLEYNNSLLRLSIDIGNRLIPAFNTKTGIPFGTVNLMYGVPPRETDVASTAGSGSLFLEFAVLSYLTGDKQYGDLALAATKALHSKRSSLGLLGKHISTSSGRWSEQVSGIGSNSDSYYEYLIKGYHLSKNSDLMTMFTDSFVAIKRHVQLGDWFGDVDMFTGKVRRNRVENLHAFWPGVEASLGFTQSSARILNSLYSLWITLGFLPEEIDQSLWLQKKIPSTMVYPLRPELIESTYYQYRATGDRSWLTAGEIFLSNIEKHSRTTCGYATIKNFFDVELIDNMPSFFLSETCKYLYLLFDENNFIHQRAYIFSTEAHPFDLTQINRQSRKLKTKPHVNISAGVSTNESKTNNKALGLLDLLFGLRKRNMELTISSSITSLKLPKKCPKALWFDRPSHFDMQYFDLLLSENSTNSMSSSNHWNRVIDLVTSYKSLTSDINEESINDVNDLFIDDPHSLADESLHKLSTYPSDLRDVDGDSTFNTYSSNDNVNICKPSDKPSNRLSSTNELTTGSFELSNKLSKAVGPKESLQVPMGELGNFVVDVFPDGFRIHNKDEQRTVEVSGVGSDVTFVREFNDSINVHIVGDNNGRTTRCALEVVDDRNDIIWHRSCLTASYGPRSTKVIKAQLVIPDSDNIKLCTPIKNDDREKDQDTTSRPSKRSSEWMWPWISKHKQKNNQVDSNINKEQIVLAERGLCMFEDKTINAEKNGAKAIIVRNTEDELFMMSGKSIRLSDTVIDQL